MLVFVVLFMVVRRTAS
jgi:hypothetical protein